MRGLTPTGRLAGIIALLALAGLIVPVGLAAALAVIALAAAVADGWVVRRSPALQRRVSPVLALGAETPLSAQVLAGDRRRVVIRQPATPALAIQGEPGVGTLAVTVVGRTRGRQELPGLACASIGPLGLARVHHPPGLPLAVRVHPTLATDRRLIAQLRRVPARHDGQLARAALGLGTDFDSIRDYSPDDDLRQINWRATARAGRPMSNQFRIDRDREVVCLLDCGRLMRAPIGTTTLLDLAIRTTGVIALAADVLGDRCGAIAFDREIRAALPPRHRAAARVMDGLIDLPARAVESDFERAFARIGRARRAFVPVFTDLIDPAAAGSLLDAVGVLARRHALVVAAPRDPELERRRQPTGPGPRRHAEAIAARDVLEAQDETARRLRRAGAEVVIAAPDALPARCLNAYLRAKARARL